MIFSSRLVHLDDMALRKRYDKLSLHQDKRFLSLFVVGTSMIPDFSVLVYLFCPSDYRDFKTCHVESLYI